MHVLAFMIQTRTREIACVLVVLGLSVFPQSGPARAETAVAPITARLLDAEAANGKQLFLQCAVCHVSKPDAKTTIGPNLWNVVGRKIAADPGFDYSSSLKQVGGDWDFERLSVYLFDPKQVAPEGRMLIPGIKSIGERADLIAYLTTLSDNPVALPHAPAGDTKRPAGETSIVDETSDDSAKWQGLPAGPGREDVFYRCNACHSLMIVKQQGLSRSAWDDSLAWMVKEQGMPAIEDESIRNRILDYLSTHFGLN
jgi:cytochrome c